MSNERSNALDERQALELQSAHDGELSPWRRLLMRRRLAREPAARQELERLQEIGELMREAASEAPVPDLWAGIQAQLPYLEAPRPALPERTFGLSGVPGWAGAGLAAAAVGLALALFVNLGPSEVPMPGSVQWLDSGGRATLVLQDDAEATIIWVLPETARVEPADGRNGNVRV